MGVCVFSEFGGKEVHLPNVHVHRRGRTGKPLQAVDANVRHTTVSHHIFCLQFESVRAPKEATADTLVLLDFLARTSSAACFSILYKILLHQSTYRDIKMAATAARQRQLLVLLGLLSVWSSMAAEAVDKSKEVVVDAYALVQAPGCNVGRPNSLVLPPGRLLLCCWHPHSPFAFESCSSHSW